MLIITFSAPFINHIFVSYRRRFYITPKIDCTAFRKTNPIRLKSKTNILFIIAEIPPTPQEPRERWSSGLVRGGWNLQPGAGDPQRAPGVPGTAAPAPGAVGPAAEGRRHLLGCGKEKIKVPFTKIHHQVKIVHNSDGNWPDDAWQSDPACYLIVWCCNKIYYISPSHHHDHHGYSPYSNYIVLSVFEPIIFRFFQSSESCCLHRIHQVFLSRFGIGHIPSVLLTTLCQILCSGLYFVRTLLLNVSFS